MSRPSKRTGWARRAYENLTDEELRTMSLAELAEKCNCAKGTIRNLAIQTERRPACLGERKWARSPRFKRLWALNSGGVEPNGWRCRYCGDLLSGAQRYFCDDVCRDQFISKRFDVEDPPRTDGEWLFA